MSTPTQQTKIERVQETKRYKVTLIIRAANDSDILHQVTNILELNTDTYTLGAIVSEEEMMPLLDDGDED